MTTVAAYPATMADLRGDPAHSSLWSNYGGPLPLSARVPDAMSSMSPPMSERSRSNQTSVEHTSYPANRYPQDEADLYDRQTPSTLTSQPSYSSLKRSFSETEPPAYQEIVQDLRDEGSKGSADNDHKLLAFKKSQDNYTILDQHGRMQQMELSAQLHGMFFLSELPSSSADGSILQPELTCYRRNLFQISGSLITPRGQLSVVTEAGETVGVSTMEVTISAIESVDGNPVRLIVIPWKTPPPNSPETNLAPDQEPPPLPLIPFQDEGTEPDGEYAAYPVGWRRLQFRIATANNGRRKELQQHFVLHLKVRGTLANGTKIVLTESTTAPIVVRGRSPRNFQARKEIPLLGSSAGSRGQALVETGVGVVAGAVNVKQEVKARGIDTQLPRTAFTFSAQKLPGDHFGSMRSSTYPAWNTAGQLAIPQVPSSNSGSYPATTVGADAYSKLPLSGTPHFTAEPQEVAQPTPLATPVQLSPVAVDQQHPPMRPQYTYGHPTAVHQDSSIHASPVSGPEHALSIPRYIDDPRPSKSPRHLNHPSIQSMSSMTTNDASPEYRYGPYAPVNISTSNMPQPNYNPEPIAALSTARSYYPPATTWTTGAGEPTPNLAYANTDGRPFSFPQEPYKPMAENTPSVKPDPAQPPGQASTFSEGPRGSYDAMNQYSWSEN